MGTFVHGDLAMRPRDATHGRDISHQVLEIPRYFDRDHPSDMMLIRNHE